MGRMYDMETNIRKRPTYVRVVAVPLTLCFLIFLSAISASAFKASRSRSPNASSIQQGTAIQQQIKGGTQSTVSRGSELSMIQLQSVVSQRQMAVQQTTQMMNQLNESLKGSGGSNCLVCNIGR